MTLLRPTSLNPTPASPPRPAATAISARTAFFQGSGPAAEVTAVAAPQHTAPAIVAPAAPSAPAAGAPAPDRYRRPGSLLDIRV